jgi:hypothetical protein
MVMASGRYGSGTAVWLGLNLPFHASIFKNLRESWFVVALLHDVARSATVPAPAYTARYVDDEQSDIQVSGGRGVLFKQTQTDQWHATVNGREARIYRAGPGMMYVPVAASERPAKVSFQYRSSNAERLGWVITIAAAVALLVFGARWRRRRWRMGGWRLRWQRLRGWRTDWQRMRGRRMGWRRMRGWRTGWRRVRGWRTRRRRRAAAWRWREW